MHVCEDYFVILIFRATINRFKIWSGKKTVEGCYGNITGQYLSICVTLFLLAQKMDLTNNTIACLESHLLLFLY